MRLPEMLQFRFGLSDFLLHDGDLPRGRESTRELTRNHHVFFHEPVGDECPRGRDLTFLWPSRIGAGLGLSWGASSARGDDKADAELLKPFQGTWASSGEGIDATWTFDGDKIKAFVAGMEYTCKAKIDKDAKPHSSIDLTVVDGPEEAKGKMSKGIYKLDGEKLTLCVSLPGKEDRPKDFAQVDDEAYLFELKKEKKKD